MKKYGFNIVEELYEINNGYQYYYDNDDELTLVSLSEMLKESKYMDAE